jgi:hypothetical protein
MIEKKIISIHYNTILLPSEPYKLSLKVSKYRLFNFLIPI